MKRKSSINVIFHIFLVFLFVLTCIPLQRAESSTVDWARNMVEDRAQEKAEEKAYEERDELFTRRFALLVGANHGGKDRVTLRYAVDDARAVQNVLEEMGGIFPRDSRFLANPTRADRKSVV